MPIECSIVFVHGLRGHRRNTWTKDGVCWPAELLSKEDALAHVRVLTFGYDADIVKLIGRPSLNSLFDHSINLLNALSRARRQNVVSWLDTQEIDPDSNTKSDLVGPPHNFCCPLAWRTDCEGCSSY